MKKKILFVCLGNICRSSAAEAVMLSLLKESNLSDLFLIDSAGISGYHQGELADHRMRHFAAKRGYDLVHRSRQVKVEDFDKFDMLIAMDDQNVADLKELSPSPEEWNKIYRMTSFSTREDVDYVPDPYYGGIEGFDRVLDILEDACKGLLNSLTQGS